MGIGHQGIHKGKEVTGSMQRKAEWISSIIQAVRQGEDKLNYALNYSGDRRDIHLEECEVFIKIEDFHSFEMHLGFSQALMSSYQGYL